MGSVFVLRMASLFAMVDVAVKGTLAVVCAVESANPFFSHLVGLFCSVLCSADLLVSSIAAKDLLFNLTAVAAPIYADFTGTT